VEGAWSNCANSQGAPRVCDYFQSVFDSWVLQGGPKNLKTTRGQFFWLRLLVPPPYCLPNRVCFRPKKACFFQPSFEEISHWWAMNLFQLYSHVWNLGCSPYLFFLPTKHTVPEYFERNTLKWIPLGFKIESFNADLKSASNKYNFKLNGQYLSVLHRKYSPSK